MDIQKTYGSRDTFIWKYSDNKIIDNKLTDYKNSPSKTELAEKISKDLKKLGMKFI